MHRELVTDRGTLVSRATREDNGYKTRRCKSVGNIYANERRGKQNRVPLNVSQSCQAKQNRQLDGKPNDSHRCTTTSRQLRRYFYCQPGLFPLSRDESFFSRVIPCDRPTGESLRDESQLSLGVHWPNLSLVSKETT